MLPVPSVVQWIRQSAHLYGSWAVPDTYSCLWLWLRPNTGALSPQALDFSVMPFTDWSCFPDKSICISDAAVPSFWSMCVDRVSCSYQLRNVPSIVIRTEHVRVERIVRERESQVYWLMCVKNIPQCGSLMSFSSTISITYGPWWIILQQASPSVIVPLSLIPASSARCKDIEPRCIDGDSSRVAYIGLWRFRATIFRTDWSCMLFTVWTDWSLPL